MNTAPSSRTQVKRVASNASYDAGLLHAIIDAAYVCHVAFADDKGVHAIPTACWREGDYLYIHGSNGSRMIGRLLAQDCCVTITHVDGLVLARAAFNHSMNYRSAMIYGRFELVDEAGKRPALEAFMEHLAPGRQAGVRPGNDKEYAATTVLRIPLTEAACKVRSGPPKDDADDLGLPVWAGVLPLVRTHGAPVADARCTAPAPAPVPDYVRGWQDSA
jgi:nitroimidazol reductase NimA-like FMN-containing flavoprotein (pyridoxamine 5'-phosphate oxidase superfamily)